MLTQEERQSTQLTEMTLYRAIWAGNAVWKFGLPGWCSLQKLRKLLNHLK